MSISSDIKLLKKTSLFAPLSQEHLRLLVLGTEHITLSKDQTLFRQDEPSDAGFIIHSGKIKLFHTKNQNQKLLGVFGEGCLLAETSIFVENKCLVEAIASTKSDVLMIRRGMVRRILEEYPEITKTLHQQLLKKLVETQTEVNKVGIRLKNIPHDPSFDGESYLNKLQRGRPQ